VLAETIPGEPDDNGDRWEVSAWTDEPLENGATRRVVMGLRRAFGDRRKFPVEGVQFHPESFLTLEGPKLLRNFLDSAPTELA
jgi:anthranilate/para-aminobenzoate synthase component II